MSKSALYLANTLPQSVAIDGIINFGTIIRRYGSNLTAIGGNAVLKGAGYYKIDANVTFSDTASGEAAIALFADGVPIPGATASITTGTASAVHSFTIPAVARVTCCKPVVITAAVSGVAIDVENAAMVVEKL